MLTIKDVHKEYRTGDLVQRALDGVSLSFREQEFVAILGPSGSGKTTLLNITGGLDRYDSGEMSFRGVPTSRYTDRDWDAYRNHTIGFIFQSYNLIPHQTLLSNVELAMTLAGVRREERRERALRALERVGLKEQAMKKPSQLSGGQMQRVAIARALVNEPSILLADEPTGALDSDTGEQVMELLREVAKDHLVIMVTHNPDLAQRYATRIIHLKDGRITDDSDPYDPPPATPPEEAKRKVRKPSMSFATALSLSVSNLLSKKARTLLVSFATSIGIVGIALILSLSNGANNYIRQMERDSLSQYPIEITTSSFSMEQTMLTFAQMRDNAVESAGDGITEQQMVGGMLASTNINDLASLKRWFDSGYSDIDQFTRGISYSYGISPQIYQLRGDGYSQVNPDQTLAAFGITMDDSLSGALSTHSLNETFLPLPADETLYRDDYDLLAGSWPRRDTDCVLVLTGSGGIPDILLYSMGFKDADSLDSKIDAVVKGSGVTATVDESRTYDPQDFLGVPFRLLPACDRYEYDESLGVWVDVSGDEARMLELLHNAEEMRICGVIRPKAGVSYGILRMGIQYPASLNDRLIARAEGSAVVAAQRATPDIDVLTGIPFGEAGDLADLSLTDMITFNPEHLSEAVSFRWDQLHTLETDQTRITAQRLVRILRELSRTGQSRTLREMVEAGLPLLMDLIEIDEERIGDVVSFAMDEARLLEIFTARAQAMSASYSVNLSKFGWADPRTPTCVTIYPNDFDGKNEVIRRLEAYNTAMEAEGYPEKAISYTDYVGTLTSTVTTIIDVITYVLIAFVAVALVVSSIMIGIIIYISVLERRKEIGILRAMGASKRNITEVFNAETFIIGLLAGAFGLALTLLLQVPINQIIRTLADQEGIRASLPAMSGGVLILLCVFLTFVGGFIPSRKAARQDPVAALRSE